MIAKAVHEEIELVFCDLKAVEAVKKEKIPKEYRLLALTPASRYSLLW
jgi:hypothetical protein